MPSCSIFAINNRTDFIIIPVFDALIDSTTSLKFSSLHTRKNSIHDSTIPAGVSPYRLMMRSDNDPWFTPIRTAVWCSLHISRNWIKRARNFFISSAYSSSVYSRWTNVLALSTKFPGLIRTFSTIRAAVSATFGLKCMSAISGVWYPRLCSSFSMFARFSASFVPWAVSLT